MAEGPCLVCQSSSFVFFSQIASTSQQPSYLDLPSATELDWMDTGQPLTFTGHQVQWLSQERASSPSIPRTPISPRFSIYCDHSCCLQTFLSCCTVPYSVYRRLSSPSINTCCPHCHLGVPTPQFCPLQNPQFQLNTFIDLTGT